MAALAYVFPPVSGLIAYLRGSTPRMRFHGLQSVLLGVLWPASLYACSWISPTATRVAFVVMAVLWLTALVGAGLGRDPGLPRLKNALAAASNPSPREVS